MLKALAPGTYRIAAVATSTAGSIASQTVSVTVTAPASSSQSVAIAITSPLAGAAFTAPATIAIAVAPSVDGTISQLNVYGDGTLIGSRTTSPYSFTWNRVGAGIHLLSAVATLASGASFSSETVPVSVGVGQAPAATLMFTPSVDEAATVDDYTLEIYLMGGATPVASRYLGKPPTVNGGDQCGRWRPDRCVAARNLHRGCDRFRAGRVERQPAVASVHELTPGRVARESGLLYCGHAVSRVVLHSRRARDLVVGGRRPAASANTGASSRCAAPGGVETGAREAHVHGTTGSGVKTRASFCSCLSGS